MKLRICTGTTTVDHFKGFKLTQLLNKVLISRFVIIRSSSSPHLVMCLEFFLELLLCGSVGLFGLGLRVLELCEDLPLVSSGVVVVRVLLGLLLRPLLPGLAAVHGLVLFRNHRFKSVKRICHRCHCHYGVDNLPGRSCSARTCQSGTRTW